MNASRFVNKNIIDALDHHQNYELHQKKLKQIKKELELKKQGKLKVISEEDESLKMRVIANKLKNHEFNDSEKVLEIQRSNQKLMQKLYEISQGKQSTLRNILDDQNYQAIQNALQVQQQQLKQLMDQTDNNNNLNNGSIITSNDNIQQQQNNQSIQNQDSSQMHNTKHGSQHFISQISSNNTSHLKSLHMPLRKREATRIDEENQRMIERIMNTNASIPVKKLEKDYQNHLNIKKIIQKGGNIMMPVEKLIKMKQKYLGDNGNNGLPPIENSNNNSDKKQKQQRANSEIKTSRNHSGSKKANSMLINNQHDNNTNTTTIPIVNNNKNNTFQQNVLKSVKSVSVIQQNKQQQQQSSGILGNGGKRNSNGGDVTSNTMKLQSLNTINNKINNNLQENNYTLSQTQKIVPPKSIANRDIKTHLLSSQDTQQATTLKDQKYDTKMQKITQETQPIKLNSTIKSDVKQSTTKKLQENKKNDDEDDDYDQDEYSDFENDEVMQDSIIEEDNNNNTNTNKNNNMNVTNKSQQKQTTNSFNQNKDFNFKNFTSPNGSGTMKNNTITSNKNNDSIDNFSPMKTQQKIIQQNTTNNIVQNNSNSKLKDKSPIKDDSIADDDDQDGGGYDEEPFEENYEEDFDDN